MALDNFILNKATSKTFEFEGQNEKYETVFRYSLSQFLENPFCGSIIVIITMVPSTCRRNRVGYPLSRISINGTQHGMATATSV